jgi:hypothetical protein
MQGKTLHYAINYAALGWRIGTQSFFQATEKSEQLANDGIDNRDSIVACFGQAGALNHNVVLAK